MSRETSDDLDVSQLLAHFQEITGIEDQNRSLTILEEHSWNLEARTEYVHACAAVQDTLNEKDGIRTVFQEPRPHPSYLQSPSPSPSPPPSLVQQPPPSSLRQSPAVRANQGMVVIRTWEWLLNLAFLPVRFLVTTAADVLQFVFHLVFGYQPTPARNPVGDVQQFVTGFEAEFGRIHPHFLTCSYSQALEQARQELRFLLVYLHSPGHQDTAEFCTTILANKEFIDFVSANCVLWAVGVNTEEGSRMVVVERVEGLLPLRELVARLAVAVRMNEAELVVERNERTRRSIDQSIREEQDRAYQESLIADREKEKKKQEEQRREEERRGEEEEKKRKEEETASIRSHRASLIPQEPLPSDPDVIHVVIRMPSGERLERRFRGSDKLEGVYNFAHSCPEVSHDFTLMSNFPRKELHCTPNGGPLLSELGLGTKCALYIKDNSA
ncbi:hypothetical protein EMCRGX_G014992 [Ephydatia muelleri]